MFSVYVGYVESVKDEYGAGRIKAIIPPDKGTVIKNVPLAFPFMPKMMHVVPKEGEAVLVLVSNDKESNGQRYYIGPIISQPDKMQRDNYSDFSATSFLGGGVTPPSQSIDNRPTSDGAMPKKTDIAILGRKDTDIILSDEDVRIRAGVRKTLPNEKNVEFDDEGRSAYIKLKYHTEPIKESGDTKQDGVKSTATIVADKINLISNNGDEKYSTSDRKEGINDEEMKKIFEKAHQLPYGDVLCDFFTMFLDMYNGHVHPYNGMPPILGDTESIAFNAKYGTDEKRRKALLNDNIRIN